jgi:hypothetical protein
MHTQQSAATKASTPESTLANTPRITTGKAVARRFGSPSSSAAGREEVKSGMTNFLHWRKMTWALLLWCAVAATWLLAGDSSAALVGIVWLAGTVGLCFFWFMTQPLFRQGQAFRDGFFVRPGRGRWRVVNLHRTF